MMTAMDQTEMEQSKAMYIRIWRIRIYLALRAGMCKQPAYRVKVYGSKSVKQTAFETWYAAYKLDHGVTE